MKKQTATKEENILPFQVVPGGLPPKSDIWLKDIPFETFFLARMKNNTSSELTSFVVASDKYSSIMLGVHLGTKREEFIWEDAERFSKMWELVEIINKPDKASKEKHKQEAGEHNDGSNSGPSNMDTHEEPS